MRLTAWVAGVALVALAGGAAAEGLGRRAMEPVDTTRSTPFEMAMPHEAPRRDCPKWERTLAIGPANEPLQIGLETYPQSLRLHDHEVVLSFDDGPSPTTTPRVLAALYTECVHANFFLIGEHATKYPALARRELDEGHTIGHHSNTHPSFTLRGFDQASAEVDIDVGVMAVERALYGAKAASPKHPHTPFFRFPGFADTPELLDYLAARHYTVFGCDMWAKDWVFMAPDFERQKVLGLIEDAPHHSGIILLHDTIESTAKMLPDLLVDLRKRGYTIVHLVYDPKAGRPPIEHARPEWTSETEAIISRLRHPIVPGSHHFSEAEPSPPTSRPDPMREARERRSPLRLETKDGVSRTAAAMPEPRPRASTDADSALTEPTDQGAFAWQQYDDRNEQDPDKQQSARSASKR